MENDDNPFPSSRNLCHVSSSQEEQLKKCGFAFEDSDSDTPLFGSDPVDTPIESTEIHMVSAPESPSSQTEVFQTPPAGEFTESIDAHVNDSAEGELGSVERVANSMAKLNSPLQIFGVLSDARGPVCEQGDGTSNLGTCVEELNFEKNSHNGGQQAPEVGPTEERVAEGLCNDGFQMENAVADGDKQIHQETPARRKLQFSTQSHDGGSNVDKGLETTSNIEEVSNADKLCKLIQRDLVIKSNDDVRPGNLNSNDKDKDPKGKRTLPPSISENASEIEKKAHHDQNAASINEDAQKLHQNPQYDEDSWEFLKGVLKMLSRRSNSNYDPNLKNMNILEVAKKCGMTFP